MNRKLVTRPTRGHRDVAAFFDQWAPRYRDQHGPPARQLARRLALIETLARLRPGDTVLEIGCGPGGHLLALADRFARGIGVDLSPGMIAAAHRAAQESPHSGRVEFRVDRGETLDTVGEEAADAALFVGSLEHLLDPGAALHSALRVLRPGGRVVILTQNGGSLWHRWAPRLRWDTRHLSTDHFFTRRELAKRLREAGFSAIRAGYWHFLPRGDMPAAAAGIMAALEPVGRAFLPGLLRGGLWAAGEKGVSGEAR
ncbi:MAG: methyltransferase domain-containing protein [Candidatus Zixiibacteriota bacterium]|nr:MAG: methyltransferase domain-containing protein [candidate division Zixibacteria bacterium]